MIILRNEEKEIVDLFDTAKEFKTYLKQWCEETETGMNEDGLLDKGLLLSIPIEHASFNEQLNMYIDMTSDSIEIK